MRVVTERVRERNLRSAPLDGSLRRGCCTRGREAGHGCVVVRPPIASAVCFPNDEVRMFRSLPHRTLAFLTVALFACSEPQAVPAPATQPAAPHETPAAPAKGPSAAADALPAGHPPVPSAAAPGAAPTGPAQAGGLTWEAPAPLTARTPGSRMRAAEYVVEGEAGGEAAVLTVFYFGPGQGGSVQANLDRWMGQMRQPDGTATRDTARIQERTVGPVQLSILDASGTFDGGMGGGGAKPDQRMLAAAAVGPQGPVFFKLVGPAAVVGRAEGAFNALLDSLHPLP